MLTRVFTDKNYKIVIKTTVCLPLTLAIMLIDYYL